MSLQSWHARGKQRDEEPALDDGEDPFAFCPECGGRKRVWRTWEPGGGMRWTYEDMCETCYGSGLDLADRCKWADAGVDIEPTEVWR